MASVQFADMQSRPVEFLEFTSLTLDEFQQLVPPFEAAFQAHMAAWRLDGKPRAARQFACIKIARCRPPKIVSSVLPCRVLSCSRQLLISPCLSAAWRTQRQRCLPPSVQVGVAHAHTGSAPHH